MGALLPHRLTGNPFGLCIHFSHIPVCRTKINYSVDKMTHVLKLFMNTSYKKEHKKMTTTCVKVHHGLPRNKLAVRG